MCKVIDELGSWKVQRLAVGYKEYCEPMQKLLKEDLTEFIRHYLTKSGVDVKQSEISFEIKERISRGEPLSYL